MANVHSEEYYRNELCTKKICRFCLSQQTGKLSNIYDMRLKTSVPLAIQAMACVAIEVFANDGLPAWICIDCRLVFEHHYAFKQMCKRADSLLRQFPQTGQWPAELAKLDIPQPKKSAAEIAATTTKSAKPKKLLNAAPSAKPEPPSPMGRHKKIEKIEPDTDETMIFLNKFENDEEISHDDLQRLMAATDEQEIEDFGLGNELFEVHELDEGAEKVPTPAASVASSPRKPRLLNKSSMRILNKDAHITVEPRLSIQKVERDSDGKVEIITEIIDANAMTVTAEEPDPIATAEPIETQIYPCPHCERSFPLQQLRDMHMINHNRERRYQCSDCEKSFFSKYDLQKHSTVHTGYRPFACFACDKKFSRQTLLRQHERSHPDIPKFICVVCEQPFLTQDEMEKHAVRHSVNRPFKCKLCPKSFAFKQGLERHETVHQIIQPFPCQYCEQSFSTQSKLGRHLTAHAGKRPYPCKICSKSYMLSHHLSRHMRTHQQSALIYCCKFCDRQYTTADDLIWHSALHASENLQCPLCGLALENKEAVNQHIQKHASSETFACEFCDSIFLNSKELNEHTNEAHAEEMLIYQEDDKNSQQIKQAITATTTTFDVKHENANDSDATLNDLQFEEFIFDDDDDQSNQTTNKLNDKPEIINQVVISKQTTTNTNLKRAAPTEVASSSVTPTAKFRKIIKSSPEVLNIKTTQIAVNTPRPRGRPPKTEANISPTKKTVTLIAATPAKTPVVQASAKTPVQASSKTIVQAQAKSIVNAKAPIVTKTPVEASAAAKTAASVPVKTTVQDNTSTEANTKLESVLRSLPKGVSVRRNTPAAAPAAAAPSATPEPSTAPAASPSAAAPPAKKAAVEALKKPNQTPSATSTPITKQSPRLAGRRSNEAQSPKTSAASPNTAASSSTSKSAENNKDDLVILSGKKSVKMVRKAIAKSEVALMAKQGRINFKDGQILVVPPPKK